MKDKIDNNLLTTFTSEGFAKLINFTATYLPTFVRISLEMI